MTTIINFNGSKWAGEAPDPIESLFERLEQNTLDPRFEAYGDFATFWRDSTGIPEGCIRFWGNFYDVSAAFSVDTDDEDLIASLIAAIKANKATVAYKEARDERALDRQRREARR